MSKTPVDVENVKESLVRKSFSSRKLVNELEVSKWRMDELKQLSNEKFLLEEVRSFAEQKENGNSVKHGSGVVESQRNSSIRKSEVKPSQVKQEIKVKSSESLQKVMSNEVCHGKSSHMNLSKECVKKYSSKASVQDDEICEGCGSKKIKVISDKVKLFEHVNASGFHNFECCRIPVCH